MNERGAFCYEDWIIISSLERKLATANDRIKKLELQVDRADRIFAELARNNPGGSAASNAADDWEEARGND